MKIVLNSIALEPNRWTEGKIPYFHLRDLLLPVKEAGFDSVEVWQNHVDLLDRAAVGLLKETGDSLGISFPIIGMYPRFVVPEEEREDELDHWSRMAERVDILDSDILKVMPGRTPSEDLSNGKWDRAVAFVREALEKTEEPGFLVPLETHGGTVADDPDALLRFLDDVGSDRLKICWQPYDFADTDEAIELYDKLSDHIIHLHLQGRCDGQMELLEDSDLDYEAILGHIFESGFDGYLSIEFVKNCVVNDPVNFDVEDVLKNARQDREFIESVAL